MQSCINNSFYCIQYPQSVIKYSEVSNSDKILKFINNTNKTDTEKYFQDRIIFNCYIEDTESRKSFAKSIDSFESFKSNYFFINNTDISNVNQIDFEKEFQKHLKERGCKNEEELKIISDAHCYTMDEFLNRAGFVIQANLNNMIAHGVYGGNVSEMKDYILNNADISDIGDLLQQKDAQSQLTKLKEIIEDLSYSTAMNFNKNDAINMIDKMLDILDKNPKGTISKRQQNFNSSLIAKYNS